MSRMIDSCAGILHNFVYRNIYDQDDHSAAYMMLLQRMVVYLHNLHTVQNVCEYLLHCTPIFKKNNL
jgi:hypothetical protein